MPLDYLRYALPASPARDEINATNIRYFNDFPCLLPYRLFYAICICGLWPLSSYSTVRIFGVLIIMGYVLSLYLYTRALISVWCLFSAPADGVRYFHFHRLRQT